VLPPRDKVLPGRDIIPHVRQPITPGPEEQLQLSRLDVQVASTGVGETLADDASVMQFNQLLEVLEEGDVRLRKT
jgi:hypothetical protein